MSPPAKALLVHGYRAIGLYLGISSASARLRGETGEIAVFSVGVSKRVYARASDLDNYIAATQAAMSTHREERRETQKQVLARVQKRVKGLKASMSRRRWQTNGEDRYAWSVRWKDEGGHYRGRQFALKADAQDFLERFNGGRTSPYEPLIEEITVSYIAKDYLKWVASKRRDGRIGRAYEASLTRVVTLHISERIGHLRLSQVKLPQLTAWHSALKRERRLTATIARESARVLKSIFDYAIRREWVARNPVSDLLVELRGIPSTSIRVPTPNEVRALFVALEEPTHFATERSRQLARCFAHIAGFCGLRYGEIAALDYEHIDLVAGIIRVRRSVTAEGEIKGPKTKAGNRDVPVPAHVRGIIARWIERHAVESYGNVIFSSKNGQPLNNVNFHKYCWKPALIGAGLQRGQSIHFHALRHFAASWMLKNGWPVTDVSAMLGHSKVNMTLDVYAHALTDMRARLPAMQALADLMVVSSEASNASQETAALPSPICVTIEE